MIRQIYEQNSDLEKEREIMDKFCPSTSMTYTKAPKFAPYDFDGVRKGQAWIIEVKARNNSRFKYRSYMISLKKITEIQKLAAAGEKVAILLVGWTDGIGCWAIPDRLDGYSTGRGGRSDRNDPQDMEEVLFIPITEFGFV